MKTRHLVATSVAALLLAPVVVFGVGMLIPAAMLLLLVLPILGVAALTALLLRAPRGPEGEDEHPHGAIPTIGIYSL